MPVSLSSLLLYVTVLAPYLTLSEKKTITTLRELSEPCFSPDPFDISGCDSTCDQGTNEESHWDVTLDEVDYDRDLEATVFTYTVKVWDAAVCQQPQTQQTMDAQVDEAHKNIEREMNALRTKSEEYIKTDGIEGVYIIFDGCCNSTESGAMTKAVSPKHGFSFLEGGWYWKTMVNPGFQNCFGFMLYGDVELTTGSYCVRTDYHCVCRPIQVPDLCNAPQKSVKKSGWVKVDQDLDESIQDKPMWAKY
jgi:hypothetical protein